ncbi:MAG TPA: DUF5615 family PIN-like protein [Pyrinomonadaceae bacterium]|nr:DUF5615 family PIN-like protein [Pyrinomonadaceae bacterium]
MEQIKFYLDEHVPSAVAEGLRRRGVDVLTVQAARRSGLADPQQLSFALAEQRVIVTMDSDFLVIASRGVVHSGIAYASPSSSIGELIRAIMLLYDVLTPADMMNHVEFL